MAERDDADAFRSHHWGEMFLQAQIDDHTGRITTLGVKVDDVITTTGNALTRLDLRLDKLEQRADVLETAAAEIERPGTEPDQERGWLETNQALTRKLAKRDKEIADLREQTAKLQGKIDEGAHRYYDATVTELRDSIATITELRRRLADRDETTDVYHHRLQQLAEAVRESRSRFAVSPVLADALRRTEEFLGED